MKNVLLTMSNADELTEKIRKAKKAYYDLAPMMSDHEYDALIEQLKKLDPTHKEVTGVGSPVDSISVWQKEKHEIPMGSLDKVNELEEFREWAAKTGYSGDWFITHKLDGLSMEIIYEDGKLQKCLTRGDGVIGENVTVNVRQIPNVPEKIPLKGKVSVRGEIVMMKDVFDKIYAQNYANPRNTAVAKVREKKNLGADCVNLHFIAYWIICESRPDRMYEVMKFLDKAGFETPAHVHGTLDHIVSGYKTFGSTRKSIPYEIDGAVISIDDISALEELGELHMRPKGQIAWKFEHASAISQAVDVKWQVGPSGRITPVLEINPVQIGGVTITSVSLHNISMFKELRLFKGAEVLVSRRNDVIPYIEKNLSFEKS